MTDAMEVARVLDDLLDEMTQAAESAATAYMHGAIGEARERDKYVRKLKADIRRMFKAAEDEASTLRGEILKWEEGMYRP